MIRYAHAVYCDDIRQEISGKVSIIGVYAGHCLVPAIPCLLPKLCVSLSLSAPRDDLPKVIDVQGIFAGTEVINMTLNREQISEIMSSTPITSSDSKNAMIILMAVISPFNVPSPGRLSLNITADGEEIHCDPLEISVAPPGTNFSM